MLNNGTQESVLRFLRDAWQDFAPIDVVAVARFCGVSVRRLPLPPDVDGFLFRGSGWEVIAVNEAHARTRQRFTVAHELGHWWIGDPGRPLHEHVEPGPEEWALEAAVNAFAAELLMPESLVLTEWERCMDYPEEQPSAAMSRLCHSFQVSPAAMRRRLRELDLAPV